MRKSQNKVKQFYKVSNIFRNVKCFCNQVDKKLLKTLFNNSHSHKITNSQVHLTHLKKHNFIWNVSFSLRILLLSIERHQTSKNGHYHLLLPFCDVFRQSIHFSSDFPSRTDGIASVRQIALKSKSASLECENTCRLLQKYSVILFKRIECPINCTNVETFEASCLSTCK